MYLIGLLAWTAIAGLAARFLAHLLTHRAKARWPRHVVTLLLFPLVFMAPLADEIVGKYQFEQLCESAKEVKIYGTIPVGEELYAPEGKWRAGDAGEDSNRLAEIRDSLVASDLERPEELQTAIPIRKYHTKIFDRADGRLLAEYVGYATSGGWLGHHLGGAILMRAGCTPPLVGQGLLDRQLLPLGRKQGDAK